MGGLTSKTKVLQEFDTNDDGMIDFDEFREVFFYPAAMCLVLPRAHACGQPAYL